MEDKYMLESVESYIDKYKMLDNCRTVILGLSGGADSVCLFLLLGKICAGRGIDVVAVHVHHGIRKDEAERDAEFCEALAKKYNTPFCLVREDVPGFARDNGLSEEEAGRILRYRAFEAIAKEHPDSRIAVAHHMNDRAETVIFNMCRGSGTRGMRGILPVNGIIIRPLLFAARADIERYLLEQKVEYCTDSTNESDGYVRNRIRRNVLPYLNANVNSNATANIAGMAERISETEEYISGVAQKEYDKCVSHTKEGLLIAGLNEQHPVIAKRIIYTAIGELLGGLKDIGETQIEAVYGLVKRECGVTATVCRGVSAQQSRNGILLYRQKEQEAEVYDVVAPCTVYHRGMGGIFTFKVINSGEMEKISKDDYTKTFDYDKIQFGMQLRGRQSGDYFVMDSEGHTKSLSRFMVDRKISGICKDSLCLLADGSHIIWIVGERISEAYKIDNNTERVLWVSFERMNDGES